MSAPFFVLVQVTPGQTAAEVNTKPRPDHAHQECRVEAHGRAESPAGVAADRRANEGEELAHTLWTSAAWDWYPRRPTVLRRGLFGVELGSCPCRKQEVHQPDE